jgi:outer membrane cobalamin receptor
VCAVAALVRPGASLAQDARRDEAHVVEAWVDTGKSEKPSAFTTVLYPEDHYKQLTTLPELLSQQVGVFIKGFDGLGQLSTVSIRGSSAEQVSVFLDGIKINTAQGGAVDFSTLPLGGIERVEIIRGGASSRFGSDAIGGVINIVTKKATGKTSLNFKLSGGSFLTFDALAGFSKKFGKLGVSLNYNHLSSRGDFPFLSTGVQLPGGETVGGGRPFKRIHNDFFSEGFLSNLDAELNDRMRLGFTNDFFYTSRNEPGPEIETTLLFPENPLNAHRNLWRNSTGLKFIWNDMAVPDLQFSFLPNYDAQWTHFTDATPALGGPIDVNFLNQAAGTTTKFVYEKLWTGQGHVFTLFHEFRYNYFSSGSPLPGAVTSGTHTRRTHAVFFQDEISLLGEKVFLNPSVRWQNANDFGNNVALHFGVVGKPARWVSLKGNVENSFRYPTFDELFFPDQGFIRGNPNLEEEKSLNFDVGAEFRFAWAAAEFDYFYNAIDNSIVFVPISAFTIAPLNTGPVTAQGLEASLTLKPVSFFELSGNYTLLIAKLNGTDTQLPGRPRHLANGVAQFSWKHGSFFGRVQYLDGLPIDFANTKFIRGRALVDVGGTVQWKNHYFITVEGKNVGNVQTLDSVGFPLPRAAVYATFGYKS